MLVNRSKSLIVACLLSLILCLVAGTVALKRYRDLTSCYNNRPSLRTINVTLDAHMSQQLVEQLKKFADKNSFNFEINYYTPNGEKFSVWMKRKDVEVVARNPFVSKEFKIGFYNNDCIHPTVTSDIVNLISDLKNVLSEIPNVTITEE